MPPGLPKIYSAFKHQVGARRAKNKYRWYSTKCVRANAMFSLKFHAFSSPLSFFESACVASLWNIHSPLCLESPHLQWMSGQASLRPFREHLWNSCSSMGSSGSAPSPPCSCLAVSLLAAGSIFQLSSWRIKTVPIAENCRQRRLIYRSLVQPRY